MNRVFSNTNRRRDFLRFELEKHGKNVAVYIAVAFLTDSRFVKYLVDNGCTVKLVVRLGFPTSASALEEILHLKNVYIRYYTAREFHPKLYIFENDTAFVGSSNLTDSGLIANQEVNISIDVEDPVFEQLLIIFSEYWEESRPLTQQVLAQYREITSQLETANAMVERETYEKLGEVIFSNIARDVHKKDKSEVFVDDFSRRYQLFLREFENLMKIYEFVGRRKVAESKLPLRIEIDQFLNWIKEEKARGEAYIKAPIRKGNELHDFIVRNINEFMDSDYQGIYDVAQHRYPTITNFLSSKTTIDSLSEEQITRAMLIINAFVSRGRYYGGTDSMIVAFFQDNGIQRIKKTLKYLLFDQGEFIQRIADCIFDSEYSLYHFGKSCIQETYGWLNSSNIPICNERPLKSMQWLGFGKL